MVEAYIRLEMKQFQQLLECNLVCFLRGCIDTELRHPLVECQVELPSEIVEAAKSSGKRLLKGLLQEERVRALCDFAVQTSHPQEWENCSFWFGEQCIRHLLIVPVERPAGTLGLLFLADEQSEHFREKEKHLLYGCLSTYAENLESLLQKNGSETTQHAWEQKNKSTMTGEHRQVPFNHTGGSELVSAIGHELRAPLSIIKGYAGLLQTYGGPGPTGEQALEPDRQRHYLGEILEQTDLLETLINDLLDCSRIQQGKLTLYPSSVDIEDLCQQIMRLGQMRADLQATGKHRLTYTISGSLPTIWIDRDRLQQILLNILENAVKYSPKGGRVELEVRALPAHDSQGHHEFICLTVRDQGIGIAVWNRARLFQPYERLEQPDNLRIPGFGLGLYITRILVEAMGGKIEIQSCEGRGTDVTIIVPVIAPNALAESETVVHTTERESQQSISKQSSKTSS